MAKGEIACFEQFLLLSQCFQKSSASEASKSVYMLERVNLVYQFSWVLFFQLEDYGVEICDEIYEVYSELLEESDGGDEMMCYKTYTIVSRLTLT